MLSSQKLRDWHRYPSENVPDFAYVAEDGTTPYVAEDGTTPYVEESAP